MGLVTFPSSKVAVNGVYMGKRLDEMMRRSLRGYVSKSAYVDNGLAESVNVLSQDDLVDYLSSKFSYVDYRVVYLFVQGEVTSSSRGDGSLQKVEDDS